MRRSYGSPLGTKQFLCRTVRCLEATLRAKFACGYSAPRHTMGNNRWSREAAWWMKYLIENLYRNKEGESGDSRYDSS